MLEEEALSQVACRLPSAEDTFESLSKLSPVIILNQISRPMFSELLFTHHAGNVGKIEEQYRQMPFVDWKQEAPFQKDVFPVDTEQFWIVSFSTIHLKSSPPLPSLAQ